MAQKYQRKPLLKVHYKKNQPVVVEHLRRLSDLSALRESNLAPDVKDRIEQLMIQDIEKHAPKMNPLAFIDASGGEKRITSNSERIDFDDLSWLADVFTSTNLVWAGVDWQEIQEKLPETTASWFNVWHMLTMCDLDRFWAGQGKRKHTTADCFSDWNNPDPAAWDSSPFNIDARKLADMLRRSKGR